MHELSLEPWTHRHLFLGAHHDEHARRTRWVVALTFAMMVVEIVGGLLTGSMALLADGLHMSTHAAAIGVATLAYGYAKTHGHSERFVFGTGKVGDLAGFASAILLGVVAIGVAVESIRRWWDSMGRAQYPEAKRLLMSLNEAGKQPAMNLRLAPVRICLHTCGGGCGGR